VKEPEDLLDLRRDNWRKWIAFYENLQRLSGYQETYGMEKLYQLLSKNVTGLDWVYANANGYFGS
jgi:hypothetical protein